MEQDTSPAAQSVARQHWNQARRKAFWQRMSYALGLSKQPVDLLSFEAVQEKLRLHQSAYRGLQQVPLDQIVGSVGRYHDFTRTFLPLVESDSYRWRRVAELQAESGLPPIELYKVGEVYFVKDGNHRVSVARQYEMKTIEAYVWEYETRVGGLTPGAPIDELIVKSEYRAFLDRTGLDISRPEAQIILTEPGMYPDLELQIELYRRNLENIDGEPRSYQTAAETWYDLVYSLAVDFIRDSGVLELFPDRTEADLYVWVTQHRRELAERYGEQVSLRDAVARIAHQQKRPGPVERMMHQAARSVADLVQSLSPEKAESVIQPSPIPDMNEPLGRLLMQMADTRPRMGYQGQRGDEWRGWRNAVRGKLWELLGMQYEPADHVPVEIVGQSLISGVERVKIRITAADGLLLPAYVMAPVDAERPLPAVLVFPGHGTIRQTAGLEPSDSQSNALALAQAGYVTLTIEARGFGELGQTDHVALDHVARLMGRSWLGMTLEDGLRGLDYLQSRPDVMPTHIGATGQGLGGGLALYLAALDERIRAVVVAGYLGGGIDPVAMMGHGCDFVPGLRQYVEFGDVERLIVPRPALYMYPVEHPLTRMARQVYDVMRPSYELFSCPDRTRFVTLESDKHYHCQTAREWFERWLVEEDDTSVLLWAPRE